MPISTFIIQNCFEQIIQDLKKLLYKNNRIFIHENENIQECQGMELGKAVVINVHPRLKKANLILLHVGLEVELGVRSPKESNILIPVRNQVTLDYYLVFTENGYELTFLDAKQGIDSQLYEQDSLRSDLVPYIQSEHYDDEAEQFLRDIYPEVLDIPRPIDALEIAKRLKLRLQETSFNGSSQILGRTYFDDVLTNDTDIEKMIAKRTILYDARHKNSGQLKNTIIHECFHWYKHRHYFSLKKFFESEEVRRLYKEDVFFWIERQATSIAPRILMPKKIFLKKATQIMEKLQKYSNVPYLKVIEKTIIELASFFQVSKLSAKLRMVEIGYPEAKGVLDYTDGCYLPAYSFQVNDFKDNQTFTIPLSEVDKLLEENADFRNVMKTGRYVYLESHFVLNLPEYIEQDSIGNLQLTKLAREHLDECALVFDYQHNSDDSSEISYQEFVLNRASFGAISFNLVFKNGYENSTKEKQDAILMKQLKEEDRIYNMLSNDFTASMRVVKKWRKLTYPQIAKELYYDEKSIRRLMKGDASIELFLLFCVCLNLPPSISGHLLEKSKWKLDMGNETHRRYQMVLNNFYCQSIEQVKEFLNKVGVEL